MSKINRIQCTKNYRLFTRSDENRDLKMKEHKQLIDSMREYGFLPCFPIVVVRDKNGGLIIKDGQHRLAIAESLGLSVYWIEEDVDFDVSKINSTSKVWKVRDYAQKFSRNGLKDYTEGLEFADANGIPIGIAFALLAGTTNYSNIQNAYINGTFKVKDRKWAAAVAGVYVPMTRLSKFLCNAKFLTACMAVCRVPSFDTARLLHSASRCRDKLTSYSTRDAYIEMIEDVYNFNRSKLVGLKIEAIKVMRDRDATVVKSKASRQSLATAGK